MDLIHGGDVVGYKKRYGRAPIDFSASLNPYDMPKGVAEAARSAIGSSSHYPDPLCRELSAALSRRLGVNADWIVCGNGASDVIFRLALALKPASALLPAPTFAEYEQALLSVGCDITHYALKEENAFRFDDGFADSIHDGLDMAFICQPNNPTGHVIEPAMLGKIVDACSRHKVFLVVDECFCSFLPNARRYSLLTKTYSNPNLFILDSFTKLYAMAGLRLGFGVCSDGEILKRVRQAGQPWPVSTAAQAAGLAALEEVQYVSDSLTALHAGREWLRDALVTLGVGVLGGDANYLFFRSPREDLAVKMAEQGILIRDCANFRGLGKGYYRVAVRSKDENRMLVKALRGVLKNP